MNKNILKLAFAGLLTFCTTFVNAGIITDTSNDSFIDTNSGLEWMDFGINNHLSPDQVDAQLSTTYAGWSLASESQVLELVNNAFNVSGATYNSYATGYLYADYSANSYNNWDTIAAMGINFQYGTDSSTGDPYGYNLGWFDDTTGSISYMYINSNAGGSYNGSVWGRNYNFDSYNTTTSSYYGTLLVRNATAVSEPGTFAVLTLALMGFVARRLKK